MATLSTARQFFGDMIDGGSAAVESLVTNQQHETEWLDFKRGDAHPDDLKCAWSEAVCGFANNQGGVFIVGIDARRDKATGIDAACAVVPAANPIAARSRMLDLLRSNVEPPVPGVDVQAVERADGSGFIVCFVPESTNKPHRAEHSTGKPYMIRVADSFQNPSPSLLRSLFFPKSAPRLAIRVTPSWHGVEVSRFPNLTALKIEFPIDVQNIGIVSAKDPYIVFRPNRRISPADVRMSTFGSLHFQDGAYGYECSKAIHPTCSIRLGTATIHVGVARQGVDYVPHGEGIKFEIDVFAADTVPLYLEIEFTSDDIENRQVKTATQRRDT